VFRPFGKDYLPPDVISVDLSRASVDADLLETLDQFPEIERLSIDGAQVQPQEVAWLGKLPQLRSLSLAQSNVTDTCVSQLSPALTSLNLSGTFITDKSLPHLAAMKDLVRLEIANTQITLDGLRVLEPLRSLEQLQIDDSCISAESVESLRLMQPHDVEVAVSAGLGRRAYDNNKDNNKDNNDNNKDTDLAEEGWAGWVDNNKDTDLAEEGWAGWVDNNKDTDLAEEGWAGWVDNNKDNNKDTDLAEEGWAGWVGWLVLRWRPTRCGNLSLSWRLPSGRRENHARAAKCAS